MNRRSEAADNHVSAGGAQPGWPPESRDRLDTPRSAYSILPKPVTTTVVIALLALAAAAWVIIARQSAAMDHMATGLSEVGTRMAPHMAIPVFMGMWIAMMVAMMFPAVAPMVLTHRTVVKRRGEGPSATAAFVAGYLIVWSLAGLVPLLVFLWFRNLSNFSSFWLAASAGGVLMMAGAYQFTGWKALCLTACRTPLEFVLTHDFGGGVRSALRAGVSHGAYCLGCCWALMAVLLVVGLMNLVWMALLALIFLTEKHWRRAAGFTRAVGVALIVLGLSILIRPDLLYTISQIGPSDAHGMGPSDSHEMGPSVPHDM